MYGRAWDLSEAALSASVELKLFQEGYFPDIHLFLDVEQEAEHYLAAVGNDSRVRSSGVLEAARRTLWDQDMTQEGAHDCLRSQAKLLGGIFWDWLPAEGTPTVMQLILYLEELARYCHLEYQERLWWMRRGFSK